MIGAVSTVTVFSLLTQAAGFLRLSIIAAVFGVSPIVDAYNLGLILPALATAVFGSWCQVAYLGRYVALLSTGRPADAAVYRWRMLLTMLAIAGCVSLAYTLLSESLAGMALSTAQARPAGGALAVLAWTIVPIVAADFMGLTLNGHSRYAIPAAAPIANAIVSAALLFVWRSEGLSALTWSLVIGGIAQVLIVVPQFLRLGLGHGASLTAFGEIKRTLLVGVPVLPAVLLSNSIIPALQLGAAQLGEGAVSILGYAFRLHSAVGQIVVVGLSTVLLPRFAAFVARGEWREVLSMFRLLARVTVLIAIILICATVLFADVVVDVLIGRGEMHGADAERVAAVWVILTLAVFPYAFGTFVAKLFSAMRRSGLVLASGAIGFTATIVVAWSGAMTGDLRFISSALVVSFSLVLCFWLHFLGGVIPLRSVLYDAAVGASRCVLLGVACFLADWAIVSITDSLAWEVVEVARVSGFCLIIGISGGLGFHRWFIRRGDVD